MRTPFAMLSLSFPHFQDVKRNTEKVMKELAVQEKKEVQLQEKKKHALSQQKKLKKSITEVCCRVCERGMSNYHLILPPIDLLHQSKISILHFLIFRLLLIHGSSPLPRFDSYSSSLYSMQDKHARSAASSWVENHEETIVKTRKDLVQLESKLESEEKEFEEIRDGLKGKKTNPLA